MHICYAILTTDNMEHMVALKPWNIRYISTKLNKLNAFETTVAS